MGVAPLNPKRRRAVRLGLAAVTAAGAAFAAVPASDAAAAVTTPTLTLMGQAPFALNPGTSGYVGPLFFHSDANRTVNTPAVVTIDARGLSKFATVTFQGDCKVAGGIATCRDTFRSVGAAADHRVAVSTTMTVTAKQGAALGASGGYTVTARATGIRVVGGSGRVEVGGPELKVAPLVRHTGLRVGSTVALPVRFTNDGTRPARGAQVAVLLSPGLSFARQYRNCSYGADGQGFTEAICVFDHTVGLGETDDVSSAFAVHVDSRALDTEVMVQAAPRAAVLNQFPQGGSWHRGSGGALGLHVTVPPYASSAPGGQVPLFGTVFQDAGWTFWSAHNSADFGVQGARVSGRRGSVVPVTIGLRSYGPATLISGTSAIPFERFTLPPGTTAVRVPAGCSTDTVAARSYDCGFVWPRAAIVPAGAQAWFTFDLRVSQVIRNAQGLVQLENQHPFDPNPRNDRAVVTVN